MSAFDHGANRARAREQRGSGDRHRDRGDQGNPPERRRSPRLAEDQRRQQDRAPSTWTANITGATSVAGLLCRALISLSKARPSEAAAVASQAIATRSAPAASSSVSSLLAIAVQA